MAPDFNQPPGPPSPQPLPGRPIPPPVAPKKGKGCFGCLVGCLAAVILGLLLIAGCGYFGVQELSRKTEAAATALKAQGFAEEASDTITKESVVEGKKLLHAKYAAVVSGGSDSDLAIVGMIASVDGRVHGSLYFRGGVLVIGPGAAIDGDVDVDCFIVIVQGYVQGQIKGKYQKLDESERKKTPPATLQPFPEEEKPAPEKAVGEIKPEQTPPPTPAEPPPAAVPAAPQSQPNMPDQQPPADSPAPPVDTPPPPPATEPTPPNPEPVPPAPAPPEPPPPSS